MCSGNGARDNTGLGNPYSDAMLLVQVDPLWSGFGLALAAGVWVHDAFHVTQLGMSTWAVIPALAGMWLGGRIRARISPKRFKQFFLLFLLVLGVELVSQPFYSL